MFAHLPQAAFRTMVWKNGGGETAEIAIYPPGANIDNFDWRVSRATVRQSGPFSPFPGIDRTLCVLEGAGIELDLGDGQPHMLARSSKPYRFAGESRVFGKVADPGIVDFNTMTRRSVARHIVAWRQVADKLDIAVPDDFLLVYAAQVPIVARQGDLSCALARGDALLVAEAKGHNLVLGTQMPGDVLIVNIARI